MATNNRLIEELANELRRRRFSLLEDIAGSQRAARALIEERGSEIEENAQKDGIASLVSYLNGRDQKMIEQKFIDQLHEMGLSFLPWPDVRRRAERRVRMSNDRT